MGRGGVEVGSQVQAHGVQAHEVQAEGMPSARALEEVAG